MEGLTAHLSKKKKFIFVGWFLSLMTICVSDFRADQGRFLDYIVSWGNLTEEKAALYLRDILEALHYLHSWRIAHLDLKVHVFLYFF